VSDVEKEVKETNEKQRIQGNAMEGVEERIKTLESWTDRVVSLEVEVSSSSSSSSSSSD